MAITRRLSFWIFITFALAGTLFLFRSPGAADFANGELAKILFFHLPNAILCIVAATFAAVWAIKFLARGDVLNEVRMGVALELGAVFSIYTMASGIVFSKSQWGEWWHGDPRQVSFLLVLLILGAGLALRGAITDLDQRRKISAAYTAISFLPIFFLVAVYPRLPQVARNSMHPTTTIQDGKLDTIYTVGVGLILVSLCAFWRLITQLRVEHAAQQISDELDSHSATPGPVVRPRPDSSSGNP